MLLVTGRSRVCHRRVVAPPLGVIWHGARHGQPVEHPQSPQDRAVSPGTGQETPKPAKCEEHDDEGTNAPARAAPAACPVASTGHGMAKACVGDE